MEHEEESPDDGGVGVANVCLMRRKSMKTLQALLDSAGLVRVSPGIINSALPSIRLRAHTMNEIPLAPGVTKFGGAPDLPQGSLWPEHRGSPLPFIAQICLTDLIPYNTAHLLPAAGRLYFFFDVDAFFEAWPYHPTPWHVWYDRSSFATLQRIAIPAVLSKRRRYHSCSVTCTLELTLPNYSQYDSTSLQQLGLSQPLTDEEELAYYAVQAQLAGQAETTYHTPTHRLLGHPDVI